MTTTGFPTHSVEGGGASLPRPRGAAQTAGRTARLPGKRRRVFGLPPGQLRNLLLVLVIAWLDWLTPAGVVVGILMGIPIMLASTSSRPRYVWQTAGFALACKLLAAIFGHGPISPAQVWVPNRIMAILSIPAFGAIALQLQRHRLRALAGRDEAVSLGEINALLMSLLAHDLRSPLITAGEVMRYVERTVSAGGTVDLQLLDDASARIQRNVRVIDAILATSTRDTEASARQGEPALYPALHLQRELTEEVWSFGHEAQLRGKRLELDFHGFEGVRIAVDTRIVRQVTAILVDNAIRYARAGVVAVEVTLASDELRLVVGDQGPADAAAVNRASAGTGLGLTLCRAMLKRLGGSLETRLDTPEGSFFTVTVPVELYADG